MPALTRPCLREPVLPLLLLPDRTASQAVLAGAFRLLRHRFEPRPRVRHAEIQSAATALDLYLCSANFDAAKPLQISLQDCFLIEQMNMQVMLFYHAGLACADLIAFFHDFAVFGTESSSTVNALCCCDSPAGCEHALDLACGVR